MADDVTPEGGEPTGENQNLKLLREKAAKADQQEAELTAMRRENAILKSGIDLDSPMGRYFADTFNGDPADVEAMVAKAKELSIPFKGAKPAEGATTGTEGATSDPIEPSGTTERQELASGAPADTGESPDPRQTGRELFDGAMAAGAPWDEAAGGLLNHLAQAAMKGDPRVLVQDRQ